MTKVKNLLETEGILNGGKLTKPLNINPIKVNDRIYFMILDYPVNEAVHGFIVVEIYGTLVGTSEGLLKESKLAFKFEENGKIECTEELYDADVYLEGSIKWDGCSDWLFDQGKNGNSMLHFCSLEEAALLGEIMRTAYKIASVSIERFEG